MGSTAPRTITVDARMRNRGFVPILTGEPGATGFAEATIEGLPGAVVGAVRDLGPLLGPCATSGIPIAPDTVGVDRHHGHHPSDD